MKTLHNETNHRFELYADDGSRIGQIEYVTAGTGELYATHTEVLPAYGGQGYATQLLETLCHYAEDQSCKIVPICGFVKSEFLREPDKYAAVIKKPF